MGRLLRLMLDAVARSLRAVAGRLAPSPAPAVVMVEEPAAEEPAVDTADGPPGHWLAMVRTRAPGLHLSMQERGVVPRRAALVARTVAAGPPPSALEPRRAVVAAHRQPAPASAAATVPSPRPTVARPVSPSREPMVAPRREDTHPDPEPHAWDSDKADDEQEWTRAPTRRMPAIDASPSAQPKSLSPADAVVSQAWRPSSVPTVESHPAPPSSPDSRRPATRPDLRPVPTAIARETDRHSAATPVFAPSRDEDVVVRRAAPSRRSYPTPSPTPWRVEALQASVEELARPSPFPPLPDEIPGSAGPSPVRPASSPLRPALPSPRPPSGRHHVSPPWHERDTTGSWPVLPRERVPALRPSSSDERSTARWPDLLDDDGGDERADEGLALPDGHRERLAREQRGLPWNG